MFWIVQVVPPSVVATATAASDGVPPTASQVVVDAQEIDESAVTPAGMFWIVQVVPPSVVAIATGEGIFAPTASQVVVDAQEIEPS